MSLRLFLFILALLSTTAAFALDLKGLLNDPSKLQKGFDTVKDYGSLLKAIAGIGPEEEAIIGDSVALEIVGKYGGLVRDEAILRRVNLVGRSLAGYSDRPDLNWRFAVLNSDAINAFSAPDGYVFITRGLYAMADNDDTLAAILGHEIAHIAHKHALNIIVRHNLAGAAANQAVMRSSETRKVDGQFKQVINYDIKQGAKFLLEKGFDPQTEYGADVTGRQLAVTTGYAPGGLRAVLARLQRTPAGPQKIFSTHPPLAERIKRLPADPAGALPTGATTKPAGASQESTAPKATSEVDDDDRAFAEAADKPKKKGNN